MNTSDKINPKAISERFVEAMRDTAELSIELVNEFHSSNKAVLLSTVEDWVKGKIADVIAPRLKTLKPLDEYKFLQKSSVTLLEKTFNPDKEEMIDALQEFAEKVDPAYVEKMVRGLKFKKKFGR